MNFKGISYYLGLFCFPISILAFINILYSSYFDYFLSINSYVATLIVSFVIGSSLLFVGKKSEKKNQFHRTAVINNSSLSTYFFLYCLAFLFKQLSGDFLKFFV